MVEKYFRAVEKECWCDYNYYLEDARKMIRDADLVKSSSLDQVKTILTYCVRGERFCDGHNGEMIDSGRIRAVLERLAEFLSLL